MRPLSPVDIIVRAAATVPDAQPKPRAKSHDRAKSKPEAVPRRSRAAKPTPPRLATMRRRLAVRMGGWALAALAVVGASAAAYDRVRQFEPRVLVAGLSHAFGLQVVEITIEGRSRTEPAALARALAIYRDAPALLIDLDAMRDRLEALPWVARASVIRQFPDRIYVAVAERNPVARWQAGGAVHLIDADGTAFAPPDAGDFAHLPLISGDGARASAASLAAMLAETPSLAAKVASADRLGDRRWDVHFDGGLVLSLPDEGAVEAWRRFAVMAAERELLAGDVLVVDLRFDDRVVLRMRRPLTARTEGEST